MILVVISSFVGEEFDPQRNFLGVMDIEWIADIAYRRIVGRLKRGIGLLQRGNGERYF
jgi:hypothetical protein